MELNLLEDAGKQCRLFLRTTIFKGQKHKGITNTHHHWLRASPGGINFLAVLAYNVCMKSRHLHFRKLSGKKLQVLAVGSPAGMS